METRANYALIGIFTLAVIAAGFLFVYWFSGLQGAGRRVTYNVVFTGSVSGLGLGSPVYFNGIRIGEVTKIDIDPTDFRRVITTIQVDSSNRLRVDTKARLDVQLLSGVGSISLIGGAADAAERLPCPSPSCTITAERSDFQDLLDSTRVLARNANDTLEKINALIDQNQQSITDSVQNLGRFTKALGDNSPGVDKFLASVGGAADQVQALAGNLDSIVKDVDRKKVTRIVDNADRFMGALGASSTDVEKSVKNVTSITAKLDRASDQIEGVLKAAQGFLSSPDGKGAFQQVAEAARSIKILADNLDKRTAEITVGINRFTGTGLREFTGLATDGQRTLGEINRVLRNVDRNPQQFIFGGKPPIPEYNGRR
ncbi:MlaD family protein [Chelatococcus reniformis]|uniref:Organic solvent ABC transporter substrate-binding protein n=1 Tax=Chelatococcus reniformis TaxID=1494448 RepID=A0A916USA9_9HYPH|nr:MlaD family protein [Chelatococcus reniformis]GGC84292.1 organic solvent ABC transporter substrate-binding protein [Chelatococcus reniformis]